MMFFGNGVYFLRDNLFQEMSTCFRMHLPVGHDTFEKKKVKIYPSRRSKSLISLRNQYNNGKGREAKFSRLFSKTFPFPTKKACLPRSQVSPLKPVVVQSQAVVMNLFRHVPLLRHVLFLSHISVQPGITSSEYSTLVLVILFPCSDEDSRNSVSIMHPMNLFRRRTEGCVTLFAPRLGGKPPKYIGLFTISPFFSRLSTANFGRLSKYIVVLSLFLSTNTLCQAKSFKFSPRVSSAIGPNRDP